MPRGRMPETPMATMSEDELPRVVKVGQSTVRMDRELRVQSGVGVIRMEIDGNFPLEEFTVGQILERTAATASLVSLNDTEMTVRITGMTESKRATLAMKFLRELGNHRIPEMGDDGSEVKGTGAQKHHRPPSYRGDPVELGNRMQARRAEIAANRT